MGGAYAIALIALIVAAASGAYAVSTIGKNDVKSKHIKNRQVKNKDLANDAVNGPKIAAGSVAGEELASEAVTGSKVAPNSLTGADIAELGPGDIGELSGAELPIMWAFVGATGTIGPQSGGITLGEHFSATGSYRLNFGTDLSNYALVATPYNERALISAGICGDGFPPQRPCPGATNNTNHAYIQTEDDTGANVDRAFYVVAIP